MAFELRTYTKEELAGLYCADIKTLKKWLKRIECTIPVFYSNAQKVPPNEVKVIVEHLDFPHEID